jgi:hypothetical protein
VDDILFCINFFGGLECVVHSFACVAHFCIFERCLDSNPENCSSKQARYKLSHPSPIFFFFGGLECVVHSFAYVAHFCVFERCLDSNPESCRSMQAR